jgi:hypothetical protein
MVRVGDSVGILRAAVYKGLIGGDDWAIELTEAEWQDLRRLLSQLTATMAPWPQN